MNLSNTHLLDDCVMLRHKPILVNGTDITPIYALPRQFFLDDGRQIDWQSDTVETLPLFEPFCAGGRLDGVARITLKADASPMPSAVLYTMEPARVARGDFVRAFAPELDRIAQVFAGGFTTKAGKPFGRSEYAVVHLLHHYYFNCAVGRDRLDPVAPGLLRFRDAVVPRGDLAYEGNDLFATELAALPDLFFVGNYFNLAFPVMKRTALDRIAPFAGSFDVIDVPRNDIGDPNIEIFDPFDTPLASPETCIPRHVSFMKMPSGASGITVGLPPARRLREDFFGRVC